MRESFWRTYFDFDAYRKSLPASNPTIRGPISKRFNQFMGTFDLDERRQAALDYANQLGTKLTACRVNLETRQAQISLEEVVAEEPHDADVARGAEANRQLPLPLPGQLLTLLTKARRRKSPSNPPPKPEYEGQDRC